MMASAVVLASCTVLLVACVMTERRRGPVPGLVDPLRAVTAVYALCFGLLPVGLVALDWSGFEGSNWNWIFGRPFRDSAYAFASVLALVGYVVMVAGYWATSPGRLETRGGPLASTPRLWAAAGGLGVVGLAALVAYAASIGGLRTLFVEAAAFRGPSPPVESRIAFLKNVAPLVVGASQAFYALREVAAGRRAARLATVGFVLSVLLAVVALYHQAGRVSLAAFLIAYPLISVIRRRRVPVPLVAAGAVAAAAVFAVGKPLFQVARDPTVVALRAAQVSEAPLAAGGDLLLEFAFPIVTLANAVETVPTVLPFRWFVDLPLAFAYLAPKRLLGLELPPTVSMVNSEQFTSLGTVPVDLLSFGYFSAGVLGLVAVTFAFGALLGAIERWLPAGPDPLRAALRGFWIILLAERVMYGDPQLLWVPGFWLLVTTAVVAVPSPWGRAGPAGAGPGEGND